jgi:hypothetical protein
VSHLNYLIISPCEFVEMDTIAWDFACTPAFIKAEKHTYIFFYRFS